MPLYHAVLFDMIYSWLVWNYFQNARRLTKRLWNDPQKFCHDDDTITFVNGRGTMTDYFLIFSRKVQSGLCKYLARNGIVSPELAQNSRNIDRRAILPTSHPIISKSSSDDAFQCIQMHQNASKSTSGGSLHFGGLRDGSRSPLDVALRYSD